ncbi:MAG TPA: c-type cytochrome biogenesis protein CcsB [Mariprofundaceae bacterium]|nr:c-type cytochrome biogenesis protein CcsB [Mariprofundaceae bacterium]
MTAITAHRLDAINRGLPGFARFYGYVGAIVGVAAYAMFGAAGYQSNGLLHFLTASSASWIGIGAVAGLSGATALGLAKPRLAESRLAMNMVSWFDGALMMILLTFLLAQFEPAQAQVSYNDQSNLVSGRIIMTMNVMFLAAALLYITHLFAPNSLVGKLATASAWAGVYAGGSSLLLRWYESYLLGLDIGHAPVSNLYEVFILLFCITSVIYLNFERRYNVRSMGAFVLTIVSAGVFFGIWLSSVGQADIKPLVPALQSYWMKIHVPMNFIGYSSFAVACAAGAAYLVRDRLERKGSNAKFLASFPTLDQLDQLAYKAVSIGFPAFTLATILGAAWAAEAWGGYWSWDPKETWALIVWLTYGAYLHVRVSHGWQGRSLAWWTVAGFLVTLFCFIGVNMYLSGLHSYGRLT